MGILSSLIGSVAERLDRRFSWYRLPGPVALFTLIGLRNRLRQRNLFDTGLPDVPPGRAWDQRFLTARTVDGTYNDFNLWLAFAAQSNEGRDRPRQA